MTDSQNRGSELDRDIHWVSEQCNRGVLGFDPGPLLTGVLKFGLVWDLVWLAVVVTRWEQMSLPFLASWTLVLAWVNVAPYLIWSYDEVVMPEFFDRFFEITAEPEEFADLAETYSQFYGRPHVVAAVFWAVAIVLVAWAGVPILHEQGMAGLMPVVYAYAVYIGIVLAGPGFMGPITTIRFIRDVARLELDIQPLHPDQLGGLSNVGYYSIRTTLLFSSGSLFLPLAFRLSAGTSRRSAILFFTFIYILTIAATFLYPTVKINRTAADLRDDILDDLRQEHSQLQREIGESNGRGIGESNGDELSDVCHRLELQRLRTKYDDYNDVRLYPLQVDIILQLAGSILLPLFFLFVETYVKQVL